MRTTFPTLLAASALLLLAACSKSPTYQSVLQKDESFAKGMPVFVDSINAGSVVSTGEEGGERVVDFQVTAATAQDKVRLGTVRIPTTGRLQLSTDNVKPGASVLPNGARIPVRSALLQTIVSYSKGSTLVLLAIALAAMVVIYFIFRSLISAAALIVCAVTAAFLTGAISPYAAPLVQQFYAKFPPPAMQQTAASASEGAASSDLISGALGSIKETVVSRPDPSMVAWCLCFLALFIILNLVLGRVSRVWKK